jgi:hypothetical protein
MSTPMNPFPCFIVSPAGTGGVMHFNLAGEKLDSLAVLRGQAEAPAPLRFDRVDGRTPADMMETTSIFIWLVSAVLVDCLRSCGATGWGTIPAVLRDGQRVINGYHVLTVSGRAGPTDRSIARDARSDEYPLDGARVGVYFDPSSWDGTDVFMTADTAHVLVTERVKKALVARRLRNVRVEHRADVVLPALR